MEVDAVILPKGNKTSRELVTNSGAIALVRLDDRKILMERQYIQWLRVRAKY